MRRSALPLLFLLSLLQAGCALIPDIKEEAQFHNPFPQLHRVAVLPFFNQSQDPTLSGERVTLAYYNELQKIPGFEVMPPGVVKVKLQSHRIALDETTDFQRLAQLLGVDVVVRGSITEFTPYYPPRMGISVDWIAANPGFHPIPAGYGLPWGTADEEYIPDSIVREAEFALAREQLKTQTPEFQAGALPPERYPAPEGFLTPLPDRTSPGEFSPIPGQGGPRDDDSSREFGSGESNEPPATGEPGLFRTAAWEGEPDDPAPAPSSDLDGPAAMRGPAGVLAGVAGGSSPLPENWPDPTGFLPPPPSPVRPPLLAQSKPIISHTRLYNGHDEQFTQRLAEYFYFRDDARFGGWQGYLQRSDDFIRFCCYLHVTEMLGARGGASQSRVVWRWPIGRYER